MSHLSIIPQKFSFTKHAIYEGYGRLISPGMNVTIEIDAFQGDKKQIKDDLTSILLKYLNILIRQIYLK